MSWLFSQVLGEEFSAGTSLDGEPLSQLNVMPTPRKFWRNDKTIESSDLSRFGLTLRLLTDGHGTELLMSYLAAFPARTSAAPAGAQVSKANAADYGARCGASLARYDPDSSTWKTAQCSLLGDSELYLETWPRWGSMRNGALFLRPIPGPISCVKESGSWATPQARDYRSGSGARWDDPRRSRNLNDQVAKSEGVANGHLNPEWVEWLMGWPIGWTGLQPLEMDKFLEWQQQHGDY